MRENKAPAGTRCPKKRRPAAERHGKAITRRIGRMTNLKGCRRGTGIEADGPGKRKRTHMLDRDITSSEYGRACALASDAIGTSYSTWEPCTRKRVRTVLRRGERRELPSLFH